MQQANSALGSIVPGGGGAQLQVMKMAMGGGLGMPNPFRACKDAYTAEDDIVDMQNEVDIPKKVVMCKKLYLRLCVHSAHDLATDAIGKCDAYVNCQISGGAMWDSKIESSSQPVWEDVWEQEYECGSQGTLILTVRDKDLIGSKFLGIIQITLPTAPTAPRKETFKLARVPRGYFSDPPKSTLTLIYHATESLQNQPNLIEVGDMDEDAMEMQDYTALIEIRRFRFRKAVPKSISLSIRLSIENQTLPVETKPAGEEQEPQQIDFVIPKTSGVREINKSQRDVDWDGGTEDGWPCQFSFCASRIDLMQKMLVIQLVEAKGDGALGSNTKGRWQEVVTALADRVQERRQAQIVWLQMRDNIGAPVGKLLVELDIYANDNRHTLMDPPDDLMTLEVIRGAPSMAEMNKPVDYFCYLYGDCFPALDQGFLGSNDMAQDLCDPFVRICMDGAKAESTKKVNIQRKVFWKDPVKVTTKAGCRRAKIQLYNDNSFLLSMEELVGEATIFHVSPGKNHWVHFFGGSAKAKYKEHSLSMIKGGISPASTYRGSLCLNFSPKSSPPKKLWPPHKIQPANLRCYSTVTLVVRMYRGLYLDEKVKPGKDEEPRKVNVFVQLPSAGLKIHIPEKVKNKLPKYDMDKQGEDGVIAPRNLDILSFPGEINSNGVLRFKDWSDPIGEKEVQDKRAKKSKSIWKACTRGLNEDEEKNPEEMLYVERRSPPVQVLPMVEYAYVYIQFEDESASEPVLFSRMKLPRPTPDKAQNNDDDEGVPNPVTGKPGSDSEEQYMKPKWKKIYWDQSLTELPNAGSLDSADAGRLLMAVACDEERVDDGNQTEPDEEYIDAHELSIPTTPVSPSARSRRTSIRNSDKVQIPETVILHRCLAPTLKRIGSPGTMVIPRYSDSVIEEYKIYCHIDVLVAKNLPSMDDDGLTDPCWRIQVEDREISCDDVPKTLNPTYLQRLVIPLKFCIPSTKNGETAITTRNGRRMLHDNLSVPLPAVRIEIRDKDTNMFSEDTYQQIGVAVCKKPTNLDVASQKIVGPGSMKMGLLDLDEAHEARGCALSGSSTSVPFAQMDTRKGWKKKPQVVWAVGYSLQPGPHLEDRWRKTVKPGFFLHDPYNKEIEKNKADPFKSGDVFEFEYATSSREHLKVKGKEMWGLMSNFAPVTKDQIGKEMPDGSIIGENLVSSERDRFEKRDEKEMEAEEWAHAGPFPIQTGKYCYFRILMDFLGLRDASEEVTGSVHLRLTSFWKNQVDMPIESMELPNPNFHGHLPADWKIFQKELGDAQMMRLVESTENEKKDDKEEIEGEEGEGVESVDKDDSESVATEVGMDEFVGTQVICPIYRAPVIGYLQRNVKGVTLEPEMESGNQLVLLPDVNFQLRTEGGISGLLKGAMQQPEIASLSISLQDFKDCNQQLTWFEAESQKMARLPKEIKDKQLMPMRKTTIKEAAYSITIDSFAEYEGKLTFDSDVRMGRSVREMNLYEIKYFDGKRHKTHVEYLNEQDNFLGNVDPTYMTKVMTKFPFLQVNRENKGPIPFTERMEVFTSWLSLAAGSPSNCSILDMPQFISLANSYLTEMKDPYSLCAQGKWPHTQYAKLLNAYGWRMSSSQHTPVMFYDPLGALLTLGRETAQKEKRRRGGRTSTNSTSSLETGKVKFNQRLKEEQHREKCNRHTYLVPVGHVVRNEKKSQARFLARLRINEISFYHEDESKVQKSKEHVLRIHKEKRREGDCDLRDVSHGVIRPTPNYLTVKWDYPESIQAVVIYTPPRKKNKFREPGEILMVLKVEEGEDQGAHILVLVPSLDLRFPMESSYFLRKTVVSKWSSLEQSIADKAFKDATKDPTAESTRRLGEQIPIVKVRIPEGDNEPHGLEFSNATLPPKIIAITGRHEFWADYEVCEGTFLLAVNFNEDYEHMMQALDNRPCEIEFELNTEKPRKKSRYRASHVYSWMFRNNKKKDSVVAQKKADEIMKWHDLQKCDTSVSFMQPIADGYTTPVDIKRAEFVMRFTRRVGTSSYDRPQAHNWYAKTLLPGNLFPELYEAFENEELEPEMEQAWKKKALAQSYNLDHPLKSGTSNDIVAQLKGHIRLIPCSEDAITIINVSRDANAKGYRYKRLEGRYTFRDVSEGRNRYENISGNLVITLEYKNDRWAFCDAGAKEPLFADSNGTGDSMTPTDARWEGLHIGSTHHIDHQVDVITPLPLPIRQFWQVDTVVAHVYVLTGRNLENIDTFGKSDPYLNIETARASVKGKKVHNNEANPNFYEHFQVPAVLPGATTLRIQVWDEGTLNDALMGEVVIDLEDRWMVLMQRTFRAITSEKYLESNACEVLDLDGEEPKDSNGKTLRSRLPPLSSTHNMPIEFKKLHRRDPTTDVDQHVGDIRYWIDLVPVDDVDYLVPKISDAQKMGEFELRITIWNVTDIGVFKDAGQRNDLIVKARLLTTDYHGKQTITREETDTHKFCNITGTFNWRWKFPLQLPLPSATLFLTLYDQDTISADDPLYKTKELPLDHLVRIVYEKWNKNPNEPVGAVTMNVIFNEFLDPAAQKECCIKSCCTCFRCCTRVIEASAANLKLDVQCVPMEYALEHPVGKGREGPQPLPMPTDRVDWNTCLSAPLKMFKIILGPNKYRMLMWFCCCSTFIFLIITALSSLFLLTNINTR